MFIYADNIKQQSNQHHMNVILAAGAAGLAGYVWGKRKERRELGNAYVTYQDNGSDSPQYGHIHYGSQGVRYNQKHRHHHQTDYNATGR
jgi:hypothetical protein